MKQIHATVLWAMRHGDGPMSLEQVYRSSELKGYGDGYRILVEKALDEMIALGLVDRLRHERLLPLYALTMRGYVWQEGARDGAA